MPWTTACQASLSLTVSQSLPMLMSIALVVTSSHLILCHPLLLLPSIFNLATSPKHQFLSPAASQHVSLVDRPCASCFTSLNQNLSSPYPLSVTVTVFFSPLTTHVQNINAIFAHPCPLSFIKFPTVPLMYSSFTFNQYTQFYWTHPIFTPATEFQALCQVVEV